MNNENKPSVIAELTAALASMAERAAAAEAEAEQYKKSSGEWYQFFTSKDKELRDTQAELQKAREALEAKEGEQNPFSHWKARGILRDSPAQNNQDKTQLPPSLRHSGEENRRQHHETGRRHTAGLPESLRQ